MSIEMLVQSIDARLGELNQEIARLSAARAALHNGAEQPPPPRRSRARRNARTSRAEVVQAVALTRILENHEGLTTTALAKEADAVREQVLGSLRELEAAGSVRRSGARRGTRWHLVTDEQRIKERAAELARQSRDRKAAAS